MFICLSKYRTLRNTTHNLLDAGMKPFDIIVNFLVGVQERKRNFLKKRLERANRAEQESRLKRGKHESYGFGSSAPRFEEIMLTSSPGARSLSQLNLSALRKTNTSTDDSDNGNVCPRFHAYHRRAASAHAGKLTPTFSLSIPHPNLTPDMSSPVCQSLSDMRYVGNPKHLILSIAK